MAYTPGTLTSVAYIDPWGTTPPGTTQTGVVAKTSANPAGLVLAGCIALGTTPLVNAVGAFNNMVRILPPWPLSSGEGYQVWLQWVAQGTTPDQITWPVNGMLTANLVLPIPAITSLQATGTNVAATWAFGSGAGGSGGANLQIFTSDGLSAGYMQVGGNSGSKAIKLTASTVYNAYIQAVQPAYIQPEGGFTAPYAYGPWSAPIPVVSASPAITGVAFDGANLSVTWTPPAIPTAPGPNSVAYSVVISVAGTVVGTFPAAAGGGVATIGNIAPGAAVTAAGQVMFGPATGPLGTSATAITATPSITAATVATAGANVSVAATAAAMTGLPAGTAIEVTLLQDGATVATATATGSPPTATLSTKPVAGSAYTLSAQAALAGTVAISGPPSAPAPVVLATPAAPTISYDGATLTASWAPVPDGAVQGYQVTVVGAGATIVTVTPETALTLPLLLDPGASATVTIQPVTALGTGLSAQASYTFVKPAAPTITAAQVDGAAVNLQWAPSAGLAVDGYQVILTGVDPGGSANIVATLYTNRTALAAALPLDDIARTWTASVTPTVRGAAVAGSAASLALLTATPVIELVSLATSGATTVATVAWTLAGYASNMVLTGVKLRVRVLDGNDVVATHSATFTGNAGNVPVTLPADIARPAVAAQLVTAEQQGTAGEAVLLPAVQPTGLVAGYDGETLTFAWAGGGSGVTGHKIVLTPSTGNAVNFVTGPDTGFQTSATLPWGPTWAATVQPFGDITTGLASASAAVALPQVTAPVVARTSVDGNQVSAAWSSAGAHNITYVVAVLTKAGAALATQNAGPALSATLAMSAPPPIGATLTVTAMIGQATGPVSAAAPVQAAIPTITSATIDGAALVTLNWSVPNGATLTAVQPVLAWPGSEMVLASAAATSPVTFTLPASAPNGAAASLRGVDGIATGPGSAGAVLPALAPTGLAITYDGAKIYATWDPSPEGFASSYAATLRVTDKAAATTNYAVPQLSLAYKPPTTPPNAVATLEVALAAGNSTGPATAAVTVLTQIPQLSAASYDGTTVSLTWAQAATAPATAMKATLLNGGGEAQSALFTGTTGSFDAAAGPLAVILQAIGPGTSGPVAAAVALITTAPVIQSVAFDSTGVCKIIFTAFPGATSYRLVLTRSGTSIVDQDVPAVAGATMTATLPAGTFNADLGYSVAVAVKQTIGSCTLAGPLSDPLPIVSRAPAIASVTFDGNAAAVTWQAVPDAGLIGYQVSQLSGTTATALGQTSGTRLTVPVTTYVATDSVLVQAIAAQPGSAAALITGPAAKAPLTSLGLFLSSGAGAPYIAPANVSPVTASKITMLLPDLFPAVPDPMPSVAPFELSLIGTAPVGTWQPGLFYQLVLDVGSAAWTFPTDSGPVRTSLFTSYQAFLKAIQDAKATPVAIATVQQAISRAMPQTFAETLVYAYGIAFDQGCFDLRPGMVLRAEYESYQSLGAVPDSQFLSGFVTAGVADYEIASYSTADNWLVGLDAFLARLTGAGGLTVNPPPPVQGKTFGGGGILDAFFTQFQQPFVRLVYAPDLLGTNTTGSAIIERNPVLIAATSLADLDTATTSLRSGQPPGSAVASVYMRGRAAFRAAIDVIVNGAAQRVPIGTTVGNLLAARAARPPIAGLPLTGIRMIRPTGVAILSGGASTAYAPDEGLDVRFDWSTGHAYSANSDWLDLPLLHGDRIDLAEAIL